MLGAKTENDCAAVLPKKNPTPQARTWMLKRAWRTCFQRVRPPSVVPALSTLRRLTATVFSSSLRNLAVSGPRGIIHHARTAMNSEIRPCPISNEQRFGKAEYLEEEDIPPRMDTTPSRNAAQTYGEESAKCSAGTGCGDVNAGSKPQFLSSIATFVSSRTPQGIVYTQLGKHPNKTRRDTTLGTSEKESDSIQPLAIFDHRGTDGEQGESEDQERDPYVSAEFLARNVRGQLDHAVRNKQTHQRDVVSKPHAELEISLETQEARVAYVDSVDE